MGMGNIFYEVLRYFGQQMGISQIMEEGIAILAGNAGIVEKMKEYIS